MKNANAMFIFTAGDRNGAYQTQKAISVRKHALTGKKQTISLYMSGNG